VNVAVESSYKQDTFDGEIQIILPTLLVGEKKHQTASAPANIKSFEFHFWKQVYFALGYQDKI
jgi:hypothetical protein